MDTNTWLLLAILVVTIGGFLWIKKGDQSGGGDPPTPNPDDDSRG